MSKPIWQNFLLLLFFLLFLNTAIFSQNMFRKVNDFDGDGKADFAVARNESNQMMWYVWQSSRGFKAFPWGLWSDQPASGDYDGDGKADFAVYRVEQVFTPPTGSIAFRFYVFQSSNNTYFMKFFSRPIKLTNRPMHQDYDSDGKTDVAFLQSEGTGGGVTYFRSSDDQLGFFSFPFGHAPAKIGDMTGDGRADITSFVFSNNQITITNIANNSSQTIPFGIANDIYLPTDFDGDGIGDLTVWRNSEGNWYWLRSSDGTFRAEHWGIANDTPVPADYDGDGKTDLAIWRRESGLGTFWLNGSNDGITYFHWGLSTDRVIRY